MEAFEITLLFDTYGGMLTDKQREYLDMRYNQDLSLGEIAQIQGVSRQAVFDNLSRTESLLHRMEENIGCVRRDRAASTAVSKIADALKVLEGSEDPKVLAAVETLRAAMDTLKE